MNHFDSLPDRARVWLFAASGPLSPDVLGAVRAFLPTWASHGRPVTAEADVLAERVLAVAALISPEEMNAGVSGCGIDAMTHAVESAFAEAGARAALASGGDLPRRQRRVADRRPARLPRPRRERRGHGRDSGAGPHADRPGHAPSLWRAAPRCRGVARTRVRSGRARLIWLAPIEAAALAASSRSARSCWRCC